MDCFAAPVQSHKTGGGLSKETYRAATGMFYPETCAFNDSGRFKRTCQIAAWRFRAGSAVLPRVQVPSIRLTGRIESKKSLLPFGGNVHFAASGVTMAHVAMATDALRPNRVGRALAYRCSLASWVLKLSLMRLEAGSSDGYAAPPARRASFLNGALMKPMRSLMVLSCLVGFFMGCQSPQQQADNAGKTVDQQQRTVDHMDHTLDK